MRRYPTLVAAVEFKDSFRVRREVEYGWVVDHAKAQFKTATDAVAATESKAASIITYLGSGTGALAVVSTAATATEKIDPAIMAWGLPAFLCSVASIALAVLARRPTYLPSAPSTAKAIESAHHYDTQPQAEAGMVAQWHLATVQTLCAVDKKSGLILLSSKVFVGSLFLLILPLVVSIYKAPSTSEPKPTRVIIERGDKSIDPFEHVTDKGR